MTDDFFKKALDLPSTTPVLLLAPMEGITNHHFRTQIIKAGAPDIVATEFIRITGKNQKVKPFQRHSCPLQIQIMGCSPEIIAGNLAFLQEKGIIYAEDWIDLNVGCPSRRVNAHGSGAALLKEPEKLASIISHLRKQHSGPLSIKTRVGYDSSSDFKEVLKILAEAELDFISIHARTKQAGYTPGINYEQLELAVETLPYPVIGNGDIWDAESATTMLEKTGVRGLMVGRGAVRDPFIFNSLRDKINGITNTQPPKKTADYILFARELLKRYETAGLERGKPDALVGTFKEFAGWLSKNPLVGKSFFENLKRLSTIGDLGQFITQLESVTSHNVQIETVAH